MVMDRFARRKLGFFPTSVVALPRLSVRLGGPRLFMKRDDQTGVATGGNKVRKLEFLFGEALASGADCVVTGGAAQSNHCRQTAAAAAIAGLECHLALGGNMPSSYQGNLLLDRLLGAHLHWCGRDRKGERIPDICTALRRQGKAPFVIPYGGSNVTGALGFVAAVQELDEQVRKQELPAFTHLVFASSSGGTHAGLEVGRHLFHHSYQVLGIGIDKEEMAGVSLAAHICGLADETAKRLGSESRWAIDDIVLNNCYCTSGYGVLGSREREAIALVAETEGILLDPVYTGRAMGGLIDLIRNGLLTAKDTVLFWHTGGTPALFSYAEQLSQEMH